ncbi:MAG: hypothetical protein N2C14_18025, partial [Planctomycetales bacterium]
HADSELDVLRDLNVKVSDLEGATLGLASGDAIHLDVDAAGHGWFLDDTPYLDEEFAAADGSLQAIGPNSTNHIDLLTVAMHELMHHLGHHDLDPELHAEIMAGALELGVRKTPESPTGAPLVGNQ